MPGSIRSEYVQTPCRTIPRRLRPRPPEKVRLHRQEQQGVPGARLGVRLVGPSRSWQIYRNIRPVWEDDFSPFPSTTLLVAHARSAFEDKDIVVENNMPFSDGKAVFIFNGELRGVKIKEEGRIGAEKIFNFIRRFDSGDPLAALKKATGIIRNRTRYIRGMNIIMVKDRTIYLSTFFQGDPEYFTMHCKENRELILCSEPFPSEQGWRDIPMIR